MSNKNKPVNPVGKARVIVDIMTTNTTKANHLLGEITHHLTGEEINKFYELLTIATIKQNQLKLWEQNH